MEEYKKTIEKDSAFDRRFQKLLVVEPDSAKTLNILLGIRDIYQSFHNVKISDDCLKTIVELTNKYVYNNKQPDKSIDILDEVCTFVKLSNSKIKNKYDKCKVELDAIVLEKENAVFECNYVHATELRAKEVMIRNELDKIEKRMLKEKSIPVVTKKDIANVIYKRTGIPIFDIGYNVDKKVMNLDKCLRKYICGQDSIIDCVCSYAKKYALGLKNSNKPISFLFVGPTGVGKTLLANKYSELFFGDKKIIRFDMSEYKEEYSISKILGSPNGYVGYNDNNNKLEQIRNNPFSVVLLDEIEKAHPSVINLFLQILDEGKITDASGRTIRFDNCIIIMTSNIGFNNKGIGFNNSRDSVKSLINNFFNMEFINRIDEVLIFNNLLREDINKIVHRKISHMKKCFKEKGINILISKQVVENIIDSSMYQEFGARRIDKVINSKVNSIIINDILLGKNDISIKKIEI